MKDHFFARKQWKAKSLVILGLSSSPLFAFNYSEDTNGDLSDLPSEPAIFILDAGRNILSANVIDTDDDFFTLRVPPDHILSNIILLNYNHALSGNTSFLGYQNGTTLNQQTTSLERGEISFVLINRDERDADLSNFFSANPSSNSSSFPLPTGDYAFWLNETDDLPAFISLDFQTIPIPEPHSSLLLISGLFIATRRKRFYRPITL